MTILLEAWNWLDSSVNTSWLSQYQVLGLAGKTQLSNRSTFLTSPIHTTKPPTVTPTKTPAPWSRDMDLVRWSSSVDTDVVFSMIVSVIARRMTVSFLALLVSLIARFRRARSSASSLTASSKFQKTSSTSRKCDCVKRACCYERRWKIMTKTSHHDSLTF